MGYLLHRAIIVDGFDHAHVAGARATAAVKFAKHGFPGLVTGLYQHSVNGNWTFMVVPDGSKEGWEDSDRGDKARDEFLDWLSYARKERSMYLTWVEVVIHDDDGKPRVERHNDRD